MKTIPLRYLSLAAFLALAHVPAAMAQDAPEPPLPPPPQGFVTMLGRGSATAMPDVAQIRLAVSIDAPTFKQAFDAGAARISAVIEAMGAAGVPQSQIRSERFQAIPGRTPDGVATYQVRHTVIARVRGLARLGDVLERTAAAGVTEVSAPEFSVEDTASALREARQRAARDATDRASTYAGTLGLRLGRIVSVTEADPRGPAGPDARPPEPGPNGIDLGQTEVKAVVNIVWEIDPGAK